MHRTDEQTQPVLLGHAQNMPTFYPILTFNTARMDARLGTAETLATRDLERILKAVERVGLPMSLFMYPADHAYLRRSNAEVLAMLDESASIVRMRSLFANQQPLLFPDLLDEQVRYGRDSYETARTVANVGMLPGHAWNHLAGIPDAPRRLAEAGFSIVVFTKLPQSPWQPQGITGTPYVLFDTPYGTMRGLVATKRGRDVLTEYVSGERDCAETQHAFMNLLAHRHGKSVAVELPLESVTGSAVERLEQLLWEWRRESDARELRVRAFDADATAELQRQYEGSLVRRFTLEQPDYARTERDDPFASAMRATLDASPLGLRRALLLLETEYRRARDEVTALFGLNKLERDFLIDESNHAVRNYLAGRPLNANTTRLVPAMRERLDRLEVLAQR